MECKDRVYFSFYQGDLKKSFFILNQHFRVITRKLIKTDRSLYGKIGCPLISPNLFNCYVSHCLIVMCFWLLQCYKREIAVRPLPLCPSRAIFIINIV